LHEPSFGQYLQANLFTPLGMTDTGLSLSPEKAARMHYGIARVATKVLAGALTFAERLFRILFEFPWNVPSHALLNPRST